MKTKAFMKLALPFFILLLGCHNLQESYPPRQNLNTFIGRWVFYKHDTIEKFIWDIRTKDSLTIILPAEKNVPCLYWVEVSDTNRYLLMQNSDTSDILKYRVDSIGQNALNVNQFAFRHFDQKHKVWKEWTVEPPYNANFHLRRSKMFNRGN